MCMYIYKQICKHISHISICIKTERARERDRDKGAGENKTKKEQTPDETNNNQECQIVKWLRRTGGLNGTERIRAVHLSFCNRERCDSQYEGRSPYYFGLQ